MSTAIENLVNQPYKHGFHTDIESDVVARGLNEDVIRGISAKKKEPEWLLEFRLKAYRHWLTMTEPDWPNVKYPKIDFQDISYYAAPKPKPTKPASSTGKPGSGPRPADHTTPSSVTPSARGWRRSTR